jgi:hypothetical protein
VTNGKTVMPSRKDCPHLEQAADIWANKMLDQIGMTGFGSITYHRLLMVAIAGEWAGDRDVVKTAMDAIHDLGYAPDEES